LIMASRLPNANLEKVSDTCCKFHSWYRYNLLQYGDPLYQRELEMFLCMGVLRTYHPAYFRSMESSSIHKMQSESADNFSVLLLSKFSNMGSSFYLIIFFQCASHLPMQIMWKYR
jgi:hypothetical protein